MTTGPVWTNLDLTWSPEVSSGVVSAAERSYPAESCGYLLGPRDPAGLVDEFVCLPNLASSENRSPRNAFVVNPLVLARAIDSGNRINRPVKVFFHSHCDATPELSFADLRTIRAEDGLLWPCAWLVLSVRQGEPVTWKLWGYEPITGEMIEKTLTHHDAADLRDRRRR